jgi:hypothetical protein
MFLFLMLEAMPMTIWESSSMDSNHDIINGMQVNEEGNKNQDPRSSFWRSRQQKIWETTLEIEAGRKIHGLPLPKTTNFIMFAL